MKKLLLGLLLLAGTAEAQLVTPPTTPGAGSIPSSSLIFPLAAPCGSLTAPSYAIGNAEMGMWCTAVDGTLVLQNRDSTPDPAGRSRLTLGVENFTVSATRSEASTHFGAVQCFDEGGGVPICRFDAYDGTNSGIYRFYPTFAEFSHQIRQPTGCTAPGYSFGVDSNAGLCATALNAVTLTTDGAALPLARLTLAPGTITLQDFPLAGGDTGLQISSGLPAIYFNLTGIGTVASLGTTGWQAYRFNASQPGSVSQPSFTISTDSDTGLWQPAFGALTFSSDGFVSLALPGTGASLPTGLSCTGYGASGTLTVDTGTSASAGTLTITANGAGTAASGTCTFSFPSTTGAHTPSCVLTLQEGTANWDARATVKIGTLTNTALTLKWDNNAVALVSINTYKIDYMCMGK